MALIVASVPELTRRTSSTEGTKSHMRLASSTSRHVGIPKLVPESRADATAAFISGWQCPIIMGPQEHT